MASQIAIAQNQRDSLDAFQRKFSIGLGLAIPYPETEPLYVSYLAGEPPMAPYRLDDLWRNVFSRQSMKGLRYEVFPFRVGYCPNDRTELSLGYWHQRDVQDNGSDGRYAILMSRLFMNAIYRPPVSLSKRVRPIAGVSLAWDERGHERMGPYQYLGLFTCSSRSTMASVVVGLRMAAGRVMLGLDLNMVMAAYVNTEYADKWSSGRFDHFMDPLSAFKERYTYGPIALQVNYCFPK